MSVQLVKGSVLGGPPEVLVAGPPAVVFTKGSAPGWAITRRCRLYSVYVRGFRVLGVGRQNHTTSA